MGGVMPHAFRLWVLPLLGQLNRGLGRLFQKRIAALREREAELSAQNLRFDAALRNMAHGLSMFDQDQRLIVCNERYREMYGLPHDQTRPGTTLRSILEARVAAELGPEMANAFIEERLR